MRWMLQRAATGGLYILAVVGASWWTHDPDSLLLTCLRLGAAAMFLAMAVSRTIGHWHEDRDEEAK